VPNCEFGRREGRPYTASGLGLDGIVGFCSDSRSGSLSRPEEGSGKGKRALHLSSARGGQVAQRLPLAHRRLRHRWGSRAIPHSLYEKKWPGRFSDRRRMGFHSDVRSGFSLVSGAVHRNPVSGVSFPTPGFHHPRHRWISSVECTRGPQSRNILAHKDNPVAEAVGLQRSPQPVTAGRQRLSRKSRHLYVHINKYTMFHVEHFALFRRRHST